MLDNQEVVNFLNDNLNNIEFPQEYQFNIFSEIGKSKNDGKIEGILRVVQNEPSSIPNVVNVSYKSDIELVAPTSISNKALVKIEKLLGKFVKQFNGKEQTFSEGKGLVNFTLARTGDFKTEYSFGNILPLAFSISINYTENMVTTGAKVWLLDDMVIPYIKEQVLLEKEGKTSPIYGDYFKKTLLTGQQKLYNFIFPYNNTNTLCSTLQKDILTGDFNKTYTLKYYDGVSYTSEEPFTTTVSLVRNSDTSGDRPKTGMFNITFSDVDDGNNNTKYELALLDNPFDDQSENTRWFANQIEQQVYFAGLIASGADYVEIKAPNINSLILTNQIYQNVNNYDLFDLLNKNYAVIRVTREEFVQITKPTYAETSIIHVYYKNAQNKYVLVTSQLSETDYNNLTTVYSNELFFYYNVTNPSVGANNQVIYQLEMDTLQTYYFNPGLNFEGSFIQKGHLDRWIYSYEALTTRPSFADAKTYGYYYKVGNNYVLITSEMTAGQYDEITTIYEKYATFNGKADSKLFEREEIKDIAKRLVNRQRLKFDTSGMTLPLIDGTVANEGTIFDIESTPIWVYIFLDSTYNQGSVTYKIYKQLESSEQTAGLDMCTNSQLPIGTAVLAFPLGNELRIGNAYNLGVYHYEKTGLTAYEDFCLKNPSIYTYIKSIKLSIKPPLKVNEVNYTGNIQNILGTNTNNASYITSYKFGNNLNDASVGVIYTSPTTLMPDSSINTIQYCLLYITNDNLTPFKMKLSDNSILSQIKFSKTTIKNSSKNKLYNPKINSMDYKELVINIAGTTYNLDYQKINNKDPKFTYLEPLTVDTTRALIRYYNNSNTDVFNSYYSNSYNGLIYSNDLSLPIANDKLSEYLANNKNAYLSFQNQQEHSIVQSLIGATSRTASFETNALNNSIQQSAKVQSVAQQTANAASMNLGIAGFGISTGLGLLSTMENYNYQAAQFNLTISNMRNAPITLVNANGSALFANAVNKYGVYIDIYEGLDNELEIANDIMNKDGFTVNHYGNPRDYDHIRSKFNYVRAVLGNLSGIPISSQARYNLRQRFANGVRFWNSDTINYSAENYELALDE